MHPLSSVLQDLKDELKAKESEIQNLSDASDDLMMLEDDEEKVPFQIGEVFVNLSQDEVQTEIEKKKEELDSDVKNINSAMDGIKGQMSDLKTKLYAKFGSAINLEAED